MSRPPLRLLLCAYQCGPGMGSVSQIGWHWYSRLAQKLPTTLVTHVRNRPVLEKNGAPLGDSEVIYIDTEWFAGPLYRVTSRLFPKSEHAVFLVSSVDYYVYDWHALKHLRKLKAQGARWDLIHMPTPVSPVAATRLHRLGVPTVLGPWNGGLGAAPPGFREMMRDDVGWLYPLRHLGRIPSVLFGSIRNARLILWATRATLQSIPRRYRDRCVAMLENGVDLDTFTATPWPVAPMAENPLRIVFVGRLVPFKGVTLLLAALEQVRGHVPVRATIVGDGPLRSELESEVNARGLGEVVEFTGALPANKVAAKIRDAHVFCLPSIRESGGAVVLEAMAAARPVIAVAFGGPAEIVDDTVGLGIMPGDPAQVAADLADAFADIVARPELWRQRGETGRRRAEERFAWDAKVDSAITLYHDIADQQ